MFVVVFKKQNTLACHFIVTEHGTQGSPDEMTHIFPVFYTILYLVSILKHSGLQSCQLFCLSILYFIQCLCYSTMVQCISYNCLTLYNWVVLQIFFIFSRRNLQFWSYWCICSYLKALNFILEFMRIIYIFMLQYVSLHYDCIGQSHLMTWKKFQFFLCFHLLNMPFF